MTTISQDTQEQARQAVELAIEQISGQPPREIVVQPRLVVRETTQRPAGRPKPSEGKKTTASKGAGAGVRSPQ